MEYIDIHTHGVVMGNGVIAHPTLSVLSDEIFSFEEPFWCGLHPCEQMDVGVVLERLEKVKHKMIGVGEIGLDFICGVEGQEELFERQLDFARSCALPVTIHAVKAYNEMVSTLRHKGGERVVIHSFISHPVVAQHLLDVGCYLSYGEASLRSSKSVDALRRMPLERLFLETDGHGTIETIYEKVARIKGVALEDLKQQLLENYRCLIG